MIIMRVMEVIWLWEHQFKFAVVYLMMMMMTMTTMLLLWCIVGITSWYLTITAPHASSYLACSGALCGPGNQASSAIYCMSDKLAMFM